MTQRRHLLLLATAAALAHRASAAPTEDTAQDKTLLFPSYSNAPIVNRLRRVIEIAYAAIGYKAVIEDMPLGRGLVEAHHGIAAGEIVRTPIIETQFPDLIRVPVLMDMMRICTVTKADSFAAPSLEEAAHMQVAILEGVKIFESWTVDWPKVVRTVDMSSQLKMLYAGNVDVIITFTDGLGYYLAESGLAPIPLNVREVYRLHQYHYLHKRHAALVPAITAELNRIKGNYPTVAEGFKARGDK
jgi:polar amino acid transport system substrate-binding protein